MNTGNNIRTTQEQRLQQRLVPQQVRYVKLLEMSGPEIEDEVRRELDENPALENVSATSSEPAASSDDLPSYRYYANNHSADDSHFEHMAVNAGETLQEALLRQLADLTLTPRQRLIASYIIGNIDNNGYLTRHINLISSDIGVKEGIDASDDEMREVFNVVRGLDPAGAGAVDLRDCLLLQLRRRDNADPDTRLATIMIADYFDLFSKRHFDRLRTAMDITPEQLARVQDVIRSLNPKPGSTFNSEGSSPASHTVIPDFVVETDGGDRISVSVNNSLPELRVEESFNIDAPNEEAGTFIRRKRDDAITFIKMLELRQQTLLDVMKAIVRLQKDFFTQGEDESQLRPMILRDVAAVTGLDLSVISRATAGKWVATNYNVYPLKMFFNERVTDDNFSSHEIIAAIRAIIDSEDKRHPLSDEAITTQLEAKGYPVARRTVAKYREKTGIPVARLRREI